MFSCSCLPWNTCQTLSALYNYKVMLGSQQPNHLTSSLWARPLLVLVIRVPFLSGALSQPVLGRARLRSVVHSSLFSFHIFASRGSFPHFYFSSIYALPFKYLLNFGKMRSSCLRLTEHVTFPGDGDVIHAGILFIYSNSNWPVVHMRSSSVSHIII